MSTAKMIPLQQQREDKSLDRKFREVNEYIRDVLNMLKARVPKIVETLVQCMESSFSQDVTYYFFPLKFKLPTINNFDRNKDPVD